MLSELEVKVDTTMTVDLTNLAFKERERAEPGEESSVQKGGSCF